MINNEFKGMKLEFHILQSFPVTCLNRDDVGAPKTAVVGGTTRARVSSQCWKRQVRMALHDMDVPMGKRTKLISKLIYNECLEQGATVEQAEKCGAKVEAIFIKDTDKKEKKESDEKDDKSDTLLFFSPNEISAIVNEFKSHNFDPEKVITQKDVKKQAKEIEKIIGKIDSGVDALDIALFGRMVAQASRMDIEAASSFAHAISTHKVANEIDFFTALDDVSEDQGAAHMGSLEFNSATYYRYVSLNLGQLHHTLAGISLDKAVEYFIRALFIAVPEARQHSQSGASPWEFARIYLRKGQRIQVPFEKAIRPVNGGIVEPSKAEICAYLDKKEKLYASMFGKMRSFEYGEDEKMDIDSLINEIKKEIKAVEV